jgi:CheY-like chemotaxis protein
MKSSRKSTRPLSILIVDDDYAYTRSTASHLQSQGFRLSTAYSAADALDRAATADPHFDVVLLDVCLPAHHRSEELQVEGFNVGTRLREAFPATKLVAYSAVVSPDV